MHYKFTFIVFVLTPLIKSPISSIYFSFTAEKFEENPRFLPIVSTHRQLFHFLHLFHGLEARKKKQLEVWTVFAPLKLCFSVKFQVK